MHRAAAARDGKPRGVLYGGASRLGSTVAASRASHARNRGTTVVIDDPSFAAVGSSSTAARNHAAKGAAARAEGVSRQAAGQVTVAERVRQRVAARMRGSGGAGAGKTTLRRRAASASDAPSAGAPAPRAAQVTSPSSSGGVGPQPETVDALRKIGALAIEATARVGRTGAARGGDGHRAVAAAAMGHRRHEVSRIGGAVGLQPRPAVDGRQPGSARSASSAHAADLPHTPPRTHFAIRGPSARQAANAATLRRRQSGDSADRPEGGRSSAASSSSGAALGAGAAPSEPPAGRGAGTLEQVRAAIHQRLAQLDARARSSRGSLGASAAAGTSPAQTVKTMDTPQRSAANAASAARTKGEAQGLGALADEHEAVEREWSVGDANESEAGGVAAQFNATGRAVLDVREGRAHGNRMEALTPQRSPVAVPASAERRVRAPAQEPVEVVAAVPAPAVKVQPSPRRQPSAFDEGLRSPVAPWDGVSAWEQEEEQVMVSAQLSSPSKFALHPAEETYSPVLTEPDGAFPLTARQSDDSPPAEEIRESVDGESSRDVSPRPPETSRTPPGEGSGGDAGEAAADKTPPRRAPQAEAAYGGLWARTPGDAAVSVQPAAQPSPGHRLLQLSLVEDRMNGIQSPVWARRAKPPSPPPRRLPSRSASDGGVEASSAAHHGVPKASGNSKDKGKRRSRRRPKTSGSRGSSRSSGAN